MSHPFRIDPSPNGLPHVPPTGGGPTPDSWAMLIAFVILAALLAMAIGGKP